MNEIERGDPPADGATDTTGVQSVARAFRLLEVLAQAEGELSLAAVASSAGLALPTAHRLLKTMQARGYVRQYDTRGYALGPGLINLGQRATPALVSLAKPIMRALEEFSRETVNLAELNGESVAYVGQVASRQHMRMFTEVGRQVLPHASGVGKAILSTLPEARARAVLAAAGMPRYTDTTITDVDALLDDLRLSRARGFAVDDGEREVGVRCIAVPIPSSHLAISISGPAARIADDSAHAFAEVLKSAADDLAALIVQCNQSQV